MKKIAADSIANEMFRLLKKASEDNAAVNVNVAGEAKVNESDDEKDSKHHSMDHMSDDSDDSDDIDDLHSYLMNSVDDDGDDASYVDDEIDSMSDMAQENNLMREIEGSHSMPDDGEDMMLEAKASDVRLMQGLGKIEASLRRKGEGFAADLVRTTALSIQEDIVKEASQKNFVLKNLVKMASDLDRKGEREAAKMVKSTIMKINR
jgi:hypothetical protein